MITDRPREMSLPGLVRLPPHWQSFSAIIECRSSGQPSVLRESESPSHSNISTQQIPDRQRRRKASIALKELADWCRKEIRAKVETKGAEDIENATEVARYLAINDTDGIQTDTNGGDSRQMTVTPPVQSNRAPAGNWARRGTRARGQTAGGNAEPNPPHKPGKGNKRRQSGTSVSVIPTAFANVRFRPRFKTTHPFGHSHL